MMKHRSICALVAVVAAGLLHAADVPALPTISFSGCMNGRVNIWAEGTGRNLHVQMKGPSDSDWRTVSMSMIRHTAYYNTQTPLFCDVDFVGSAMFRVADTNEFGESAGWVEVGPVTNFVRHAGTLIGTKGSTSSNITNITDGVAATYYESSETYAGVPNPWYGIKFDEPVCVGRIRFVPRQDALGQERVAGDVFQCSDDEEFTNPVNIGEPLPDSVELGRPLEIVLDHPVTSRFFRVFHNNVKSSYISIGELEFCPVKADSFEISVVPVERGDMRASVTWSLPEKYCCASSIVQRAVSPAGPFRDLGEWVEGASAGSYVDDEAAVGVPYYYRAKFVCIGGGVEGTFYSPSPYYARSYLLERTDIIDPFVHWDVSQSISISGSTSNPYDGDTNTYMEVSCYTNGVTDTSLRLFDAAVGICLSGSSRITGAWAFPRNNTANTVLDRTRAMAVFGANADDLSDRVALTGTFGGFETPCWQYNGVAAWSDAYQKVFLLSPTQYPTYGCVAEVEFFGYTDQDTVNSGVLVPPQVISADEVSGSARIVWSRSYNAETVALERRVDGGDWRQIVVRPDEDRSFIDYCAPAGALLEYRVVACGADGSREYSPSARITLESADFRIDGVSVTMDNWTNQAARIACHLEFGLMFPSGAVQRAVAPTGPFENVAIWLSGDPDRSFVDDEAPVGVPYYYRLKLFSEDPLAEGESHVSDLFFFRRSKRLDRDWDDLDSVKDGVAVMSPYMHLTGLENATRRANAAKCFDDDTNTICHIDVYTNGVRVLNPAVGIDLGTRHHVTAALVFPWDTPHENNRYRAQRIAVYGADVRDFSDARQLTPTNGYFSEIKWIYNPVTNENDTCRYVYYQTPDQGTFNWYGNVAEVGFFGWSEQDILDSGVLVPPTAVSLKADLAAMTVSWNDGYNVASYVVQRRKQGEADWTVVATLGPDARSFVNDDLTLRKGFYEFRVTAVSSSGTEVVAGVASCEFTPKRGMLLIIR